MTLDELIREGERLHANRAAAVGLIEQVGCDSWLGLYYSTHGPTLLAVAKAAVEMRNNIAELTQYGCQPSNEDIVRELAVFDRAAGEGR